MLDLLKFYLYTGVPIITCNMLFYSISAISNSITSSQNVVKFIADHKKTDVNIFYEELEKNDVMNKITLVESILKEIIHRHHVEDLLENVLDIPEENGYLLISNKKCDNSSINEPLKLSLISVAEILWKMHNTIIIVETKIREHSNSYLPNLLPLSLQNEINIIQKTVNLLDKRLFLLFEIYKL